VKKTLIRHGRKGKRKKKRVRETFKEHTAAYVRKSRGLGISKAKRYGIGETSRKKSRREGVGERTATEKSSA